MAKKKKELKEKDMVFTSEQQRKWDRAARRKLDLEKGTFIRGGAHKTAKKDQDERKSNKLSPEELEELLAEEELLSKEVIEDGYEDEYEERDFYDLYDG